MELRQLKYFVRSAELQNFSQAAKDLFITQSTLSQQIKQLEDELDIRLFDRKGKRVFLTEAGQTFLPYAKQTLSDAAYGIQRLKDLQNIKTGSLKIGVTYSLSHMLTNTVTEFSRQYPDIKLEIVYRSAIHLKEMLKEKQVDFVLTYKPLAEDSQIEATTLFDSELCVVIAPHHPLASQKKISLSTLKNYPLILPSAGLTARETLNYILKMNYLQLIPRVELNDVNTLLQFAETGYWATVLSKASIYGMETLKAIPIADQNINMHERRAESLRPPDRTEHLRMGRKQTLGMGQRHRTVMAHYARHPRLLRLQFQLGWRRRFADTGQSDGNLWCCRPGALERP